MEMIIVTYYKLRPKGSELFPTQWVLWVTTECLAPAPRIQKYTFGYQDYAGAISELNEECFPSFIHKMYGKKWPEKTQDNWNVSNYSLLRLIKRHLFQMHGCRLPCSGFQRAAILNAD